MTISEFLAENDAQLFADALKVELRTVQSWARGERRPSPELAVEVERVTLGRVTFRTALLETQTKPRKPAKVKK